VTSARDSEIRSRWLAEAMGELSSRERAILRQRCLREEDAALEELSRELGVCKERVRQLEHRALVKLRQSIRRRTENPADLFTHAT
jgi:RNA polymerase sigma-32 factor